jgi:hypothetical protein
MALISRSRAEKSMLEGREESRLDELEGAFSNSGQSSIHEIPLGLRRR